MKKWFAGVAPIVAVGGAFQLAARIQPVGWCLLATIAACFILGALYVPKYPKSAALKWAVNLKPGQKIEVEGK